MKSEATLNRKRGRVPARLAGAAHGAAALAGVWLMASPGVFGYGGSGRVNDLIVGPIAATFAVVAMWEVTRPLRRVNLALAAWTFLAAFVLDYPLIGGLNVGATALAIFILSLAQGRRSSDYGGGWTALIRPHYRS